MASGSQEGHGHHIIMVEWVRETNGFLTALDGWAPMIDGVLKKKILDVFPRCFS